MDELPVNDLGKKRIDMAVVDGARGPKELEVFPVADARHQLNPQQMRQPKHQRALALGIGMEYVGLDVRRILQETIENVDGFPYPTWDKVAEQCDVRVRDVIVSDPAIPPIANMVFRQQVLFIEVPLHAIG